MVDYAVMKVRRAMKERRGRCGESFIALIGRMEGYDNAV